MKIKDNNILFFIIIALGVYENRIAITVNKSTYKNNKFNKFCKKKPVLVRVPADNNKGSEMINAVLFLQRSGLTLKEYLHIGLACK